MHRGGRRRRGDAAILSALALILSCGAAAATAEPAGAAAPDPWIDASFGVSGSVRQPYSGEIAGRVAGAARAPDGDLVLAIDPAHTKWNCCLADVGGLALARLAPDGTPRAGFGSGGVIQPALAAAAGSAESMEPSDLAVDASGRLLLVGRLPQPTGSDRPVVVRRLATGALDSSFGQGGTTVFPTPPACNSSSPPYLAAALPVAGDRTLVVGTCSSFSGFQLVVGRLQADGGLDAGFAIAGEETILLPSIGACCALDVQQIADGRIVIGLGSNPATVVRLLADGSADPAYGGGDGIATTAARSGAVRILALPDGRVIFDSGTGLLSRLLADGSADPAYADVAVPLPDPCGYPTVVDLAGTAAQTIVALQCQQGVWLGALDANGAADTSYGLQPTAVRSTDADTIFYPGHLLLDDSGGLVVAGADRTRGIRVERRLPTGALDPAFGAGGGTHLGLRGRFFTLGDSAAHLDSKGRLVTAVSITNRGTDKADEGAVAVSRFLPDGSADATFGSGGTALVETGGHSAGEGESIGPPQVLIRADDSVTVVAVWVNEITVGAPVHETGLVVIRLTARGAPDPAAGPAGTRWVSVPAISEGFGGSGGIAPGAGDTVLVSYTRTGDDGDRAAVVRLVGSSGDVDTSYGTSGYVTVPELARSGNPGIAFAGLPGGAALLGWEEWPADFGVGPDTRVVSRIGADGSIDGGFGTGGRVRQAAPTDVAVSATSTGKPILVWMTPRHPADTNDYSADVHVRRLTPAGGTDTGFAAGRDAVLRSTVPAGTSGSDRLLAVAAYGERPLVLVDRGRGSSNSAELVRLSIAGAPDPSFGAGGIVVAVPAIGVNAVGLVNHVVVGAGGQATIVRTSYGPRTQTPQDLLITRVLGAVPPSIVLTRPPTTTLTGSATFSWRPVAARGPYRVERRTAPAAGRFGAWTVSTPVTATRATVRVAAGTTTCVRIRGANKVVSAPACVAAPTPATALRASPGWTTIRSAALYAASARRANARGASLQESGVGARTLVLVATRCPGCGEVDVLWNGARVAHVSLNGALRHRVLIPVAGFSGPRRGAVQVRVTTVGRPVTIEGLAAWRDDVGG